jgi:AcrR family transcriptional regulator
MRAPFAVAGTGSRWARGAAAALRADREKTDHLDFFWSAAYLSPVDTRSAGGRISKGERTRRRIVERAAAAFNTRGFAGTSMADISAATGLEKGGVYNHFDSKDALALEAFDYAFGLIRKRFDAAVRHEPDPLRRLLAIVDVYREVARRPAVPGGCPILNTATEADDTHPGLRDRARRAMDHWRGLVTEAAADAGRAGRLDPAAAGALGTFVVAALEGGVLLAKLYRDPAHMVSVCDQLTRHIALLERDAAADRA